MKKISLTIMSFAIVFIMMMMLLPGKAYASSTLTKGTLAQMIYDEFDYKCDNISDLPFVDLSPDMPEYEAISSLYHLGIIIGEVETIDYSPLLQAYLPEKSVTRAELANVLSSLLVVNHVPESPPSDIDQNITLYYDDICSVLACGIMNVDDSNTFRPNAIAEIDDFDISKLKNVLPLPENQDVQLDLSNGPIMISGYIYGGMVFRQGDFLLYSTGKCSITQSGQSVENEITINGS